MTDRVKLGEVYCLVGHRHGDQWGQVVRHGRGYGLRLSVACKPRKVGDVLPIVPERCPV